MENKEKKLIGLFMLLLFFTQIIFVPVNVKAEGEGINVEASSAILIEPTTGKI